MTVASASTWYFPRRRVWPAVVLLLVALAGCVSSTGAFRDASHIDATLHRGQSTKADVIALLGVPNGTGAAFFPMIPNGQREIWYYEDDEGTVTGTKGDVMRMRLKMQQILVFFKGNIFDGYFWASGSSSPGQ